jgi:hypothetical protein
MSTTITLKDANEKYPDISVVASPGEGVLSVLTPNEPGPYSEGLRGWGIFNESEVIKLRDFLNEHFPAEVAPEPEKASEISGYLDMLNVLARLAALEERVAALEPAETKASYGFDPSRGYKIGETIVVEGVTYEAVSNCNPNSVSGYTWQSHRGCWKQVS